MRFKVKLTEALELHDTLNPKLFNSDNKLYPEILEAFNNIIEEFLYELEDSEIPIKVLDTWLVGSNASYNYSPNSDIDLHVQADFGNTIENGKLLQIIYDFAKSSFNKDYDIKVKGMPVELYVEDINASAITNGIYSLKENDWIKFPKKVEIPDIDITKSTLFKDYLIRYNSLKDEDIQDFIDDLYILRKASLNKDGEFGEGNLVFKEFRNKGYLDKLKDKLKIVKSKELTLERYEK